MPDKKISKTSRIAYITKQLIENPSKLYTLQYFSDMLSSAKSTLSEDIKSIEESLKEFEQGDIYSVAGAAGGVYYLPMLSTKEHDEIVGRLCERLKEASRIIPGGYLYMNDILFDPAALDEIARCMVGPYKGKDIDYVVTIETKGIPLALALARLLNKPIVVIRKVARLTEGTTIQMNYVTGSKKSIKTMALPIKSIHRGANVLFVDDFMKAGSTAKGVVDLMKEFEANVVGVAVMMTQETTEEKVVKDYDALVELVGIDEITGEIDVKPF